MNWDAIGAVGQVLEAAAVFVTLGYLSVRVRHAREEVRRSISQERAEIARQLLMSRAGNAALTSAKTRVDLELGQTVHELVQMLVDRVGLTHSPKERSPS